MQACVCEKDYQLIVDQNEQLILSIENLEKDKLVQSQTNISQTNSLKQIS